MSRISVIGAGYVGLVSAVCYAERGHAVTIYDVNPTRLQMIEEGKPPFHEPLVDDILERAIASGRLKVADDPRQVVLESDFVFVAVGTPSKIDGSIDLTQVQQAITGIGDALAKATGWHSVVMRSTMVPGTTEGLVKTVLEESSGQRVGQRFGLAVNPEFLREGNAVRDTYQPDRVVIGEVDTRTGDLLEDFYTEFHKDKPPPIVRMSASSAEMVKYASNAFLATKVSFINEIANICQKTRGLDVAQIADAIGLDTRIGRKFLDAGLGYGGSCFPKDVRALIAHSMEVGYTPLLLKASLAINEMQTGKAIELALDELGSLNGRRIAVLGLSFKPETDDMRESRSIPLIDGLLKLGAKVVAYDPVANDNARLLLNDKIEYAQSARDCIFQADCCIVATEWSEFKELNPEDFVSLQKQPVVVDGRRVFDPAVFAKQLRYRAIGLAKT